MLKIRNFESVYTRECIQITFSIITQYLIKLEKNYQKMFKKISSLSTSRNKKTLNAKLVIPKYSNQKKIYNEHFGSNLVV